MSRAVFRALGTCLLTAALLLLAADQALAQTGALQVSLLDQGGGALPGASVTVLSDAGTTPVAPTDVPGQYAIEDLATGPYVLRVVLDGFETEQRPVQIAENETATERFVLTLAPLEERVDVQPLAIGSRNSLTGLTLSGDDLLLLPTNEIQMLYRLLELAGSRGRPGDVAIYVDGFREFRRLPPQSTIDVIQINAEPYSAEFSEPGTRRIEIITKPGSDGTFGEFRADFNQSALNARDPLAASEPPLLRRSGSGYYSAPIVPGRWGIYGYAGVWEQDEHAIINATVLDDDLQPATYRNVLSAPMRISNFTINSGFGFGTSLRLKAEYSRDGVRARNQGLTGGFSLPERALTVDSRTHAGRFSLLSVFGPRTILDVRVQVRDELSQVHAVNDAFGLEVSQAFNAGANQESLRNDESTRFLQMDSKLTSTVGEHTLSVGLQSARRRLAATNTSFAGGSYTFGSDVERDARGQPLLDAQGATIPISPLERYRRTLQRRPGYTPTQFSMTVGDPNAEVVQWELAGFVQDDWLPSDRFTLSAGLRYERQTNLADVWNLAPRVGMAWEPAPGVGVIRAGLGLFYGRFDADLTLDTIRLDGTRQRRFIVNDPTFFPFIPPSDIDPPAVLQTVVRKSDDLKAPETYLANISYERELGSRFFASAGYTWEQSAFLPRLIDVNPPLAPGVRPQADMGQILEFQSRGRAEKRELQLGLRMTFGEGSQLFTNYTLGSSKADGDTARTVPSDSRNPSGEYGPANDDRRHQLFVSGSLLLPHFWVIVPSMTIASAAPFNITTGFDNNFDLELNDRPSFATPGEPGTIATAFGTFDPTPEAGDTIIPRNYGRGDGLLKVDLSVGKVFILDDPTIGQRTMTINLNVDNLLNTANLTTINGLLLSPLFGQAWASEPGRRVSIGATMNF